MPDYVCKSKRWGLRRETRKIVGKCLTVFNFLSSYKRNHYCVLERYLLNCPSPPGFYQTWKITEEELEEGVCMCVCVCVCVCVCACVYLTVLWKVRYFSRSCGSEPRGRWTSSSLSFIFLAGRSFWDFANMDDNDTRSAMACWWSLQTGLWNTLLINFLDSISFMVSLLSLSSTDSNVHLSHTSIVFEGTSSVVDSGETLSIIMCPWCLITDVSVPPVSGSSHDFSQPVSH